MPDVTISIGGRDFQVSCQEGEEHYLQSAAAMLDAEATALSAQIGKLPEPRMLLMAGLMLADKTAGMEDQVKAASEKLTAMEAELESLRNAPPPEPQQVEVPVVPESVLESLSALAERAEYLAETAEAKANA